MNLQRLISSASPQFMSKRSLLICAKKIRHGYYFRNLIECSRNRKLLRELRHDFTYDLSDEPLISVIVPTYNRSKVLTKRTIPSVLAQTHKNFELIVAGDHCTDDTEKRIKEFGDERIKFINLLERGRYPNKPWLRWLVAGSVPRNKGLELAVGKWIAPLDDDDEFSRDHLESLLSYAVENKYEMVYGVAEMETEPRKWVYRGSYPLKFREICHMAVLYRSELKFMKYDCNSWKYFEPDDWNLWRRMKEAGVRIGFLDKVVGKHYSEFDQLDAKDD